MKKAAVKFLELICIALLCGFLVFVTADEGRSEAKLADVEKEVTASMNIDSLSRLKENKIKDVFSFDFSGIEDCAYYASDSVMDVRELLVIKLTEENDGAELVKIIEKRVKEKQELFDGYAPAESALLKNYSLKNDRGYIFYAVGEDSSEALAAFSAAIK